MDFDSNAVDLESLDESGSMGRRSFLMGAFAVGAASSASLNYGAMARAARVPIAKDGAFELGVSSGFPRPRGIMLWTHLKGKGNRRIRLEVARDRKFANVVQEKLVTVRQDRSGTARTFVKGLKPDEQYFYRFATENSSTQVGRFKTAPPLNSKKPIRIAFYSCQNYESGFFNAQRAIANEPDLDLVLCLGDYIYEYSDNAGVRLDRSGDNKDGDAQFLREYRQKYSLYKRDPNLKAMHAAHPFTAVWDDHEVEDNHADGKPSSAQSDPNATNLKNLPRRVSYAQRRANGYRAFFNFHPRARFKGERDRIYEDYRLGGLVDLMLTDQRQYRDQQPCSDAILLPCADDGLPRAMLGETQKNWLLRSLKASPATWKVWGTELMLMGVYATPGAAAQRDAWDGYAHERAQILNYILDNNIQNVVAITGDIHTFFAGTAYTLGDSNAPGSRAAMPEFVGGSATSTGLPEATGFDSATLSALADAFNPHVDFYDFERRGYGVIEIKPNEVTCELKTVNALVQNAPATSLSKFRVPLGSRSPERVS